MLPLSQQSLLVLSSLTYHDYEERPRLVADLADKRFMVLRNQGLLTLGETIADALFEYVSV